MTLVSVPCAVCSGTNFEPVFESTIAKLDDEAAAFFSSSRSNAGYLPIVRCRECGLLQSNPRDDNATLARVYEGLEDRVYDSEDANRDFDARAHLSLVLQNQKPPGRLLDVGCATGIFAARAHEAGFDTIGLDASLWAIERARLRAPGARFEAGTLESVDIESQSLDVITLWDVLEHVDSPRQVLDKVRGWLKPGGFIYVSVPNSGSVVARAMGKHWVLLLREHLWYFSPETIRRLLAGSGFEVTVNRPKWVSFSLANVAGRLSQYRGPLATLAAKASKSGILRSSSVRFPMGEMDVVARRN